MVQSGDTNRYSDKFIQLQLEAVESNSARICRSWPARLPVFQVAAAREREQRLLGQLSDAQAPDLYQPQQSEPRQLHYISRAHQQLSAIDLRNLSLTEKLQAALQLVTALSSLHARDVLHLALRPSTFLLTQNLDHAEIIDFSSAQVYPRTQGGLQALRPEFADPHFLAPEQSYPTGRTLDSRTDLYALGAVLYWLFCGKPPFASQPADIITYAQASRRPEPIPTVSKDATLQSRLEQILQTLLEKSPDKRYQSCAGLIIDLHQMLDTQSTPAFVSHQHLPDRLQIPDHLYGRDDELKTLMSAFSRVSHGPSEALLIGGYSGVGKSALVNKVRTPIQAANGLFVAGKFDQYQRSTPYSAISQAFSHFIRYLLSLSKEAVSQWRQRLNDALSPNGQVLIDIIPELAQLLGPQPAVAPAGPDEQQNRFNRTFLKFVREICVSNKPLALFIDDLQWADRASLNLLKQLLSDTDSRYCLILGAYRDNEVDERHPFMQMLNELSSHTRLSQIQLRPLAAPVVERLIADTLHRPQNAVRELAELVYQKTAGNPFFLRQFLQELYQSELLDFDYAQQHWHWSVSAIQQQHMTDNVVDLMIRKIDRLPTACRRLLQQGACIGGTFSLSLLQRLNESNLDLYDTLSPAFDAGLLIAQGNSQDSCGLPAHLRFQHDRVQQAAYATLDHPQRTQIHYQIGQHLLASLKGGDTHAQCFDLANHFNQARTLLTATETFRVIQINYQAALKAKTAAAYSTALLYLDQLFQLGNKAGFDDENLHTRALMEQLECLYLAGEYERAEQLKSIVEGHCQNSQLRVQLHNILITQYTRYGELQRAIDQALTALQELGYPLPAAPTMDDIGAAIADAQQALQQLPFAELAKQPAADDPAILHILDILMAMQPCCYNSGSPLFPLTILGLLKLTMQYGNSPYSSYVYMMYGLMCTKVLKDYDSAFEAAHYSDQIAQHYPANPLLQGRLSMMRSNFILPWQETLQASAELRDQAYQQCLEQGDFYWGIHAYIFGFYANLLSTPNLDQLLQRTELVSATCAQIKQPAQVYLSTLQSNLLKVLNGDLDNLQNLDHQPGYEAQAQAHYVANNYMCGRYDRLLARLLQGYLFGNYQDALAISLSPDLTMQDLDEGIFHEAVYCLFNLLCIEALCQQSPDSMTDHYQQWYTQAWERYQGWYQRNPDTFAAGFYLIQAEQSVTRDDPIEASCYYERAIMAAQKAGFALLEALSNERAAKFRLQQQQTVARGYFEQALVLYRAWGAQAKVTELEQRLGQLNPHTVLSDSQHMDWQAVVSASHDMSSQLSTDQLQQRILQRASTMTGARQAALFQQDHQQWQLIALQCEGEQVTDLNSAALMPEQILRYCFNSQQSLVLKDAAGVGEFTLDSDIQRRQVQSVLGLPLLAQNKCIGVLYLEHSDTRNLFTPQKVRVVELLASQFAISYQNARYYEQLQQHNAHLEQTVQERTRQLNKKNHHLEAILQALPIPFVVSDLDGRLVECNDRLLQQFEVDEAIFQQENAVNFYVNPDDRATMLHQLQQQGHVNDFECQLKTYTGKTFWALFSATRIELETGSGLFVAISDISNRKARESELHQQASTDPLTGACNRRAFFAAPALAGNQLTGQPCCVAMLDLDHFKVLNDRYGHAAGDEVLKQFANLVQHSLRDGDIFGRLGGEEFALILVNVLPAEAEDVLQRICQRVSEQVVRYQNQQIHYTTSAGLTHWSIEEPLDTALNRADRLLYQAKAQGRNRVVAVLQPTHCEVELDASS